MKSLRDYLTLTKPRLNSLAVATALGGYYLGATGPLDGAHLILTLVGTTAVAAGCGALNQWLEVEADRRMNRTRSRPLPAGRLDPSRALWFGLVLSAAGLAVLALFVNELTALLGLAALVSYLVLYTPLKRFSSLCTVVGAIPGALPPVMGWAAVRNEVGSGGWTLFAILFLWQMPHFLSIGWMYREDYARAGLPMLSVGDPMGRATGLLSVAYAFALWPVSLFPTPLGLAGAFYFWSAFFLSLGFLVFSILMALKPSQKRARGLFWYSITYLPLVFVAMAIDKTP